MTYEELCEELQALLDSIFKYENKSLLNTVIMEHNKEGNSYLTDFFLLASRMLRSEEMLDFPTPGIKK